MKLGDVNITYENNENQQNNSNYYTNNNNNNNINNKTIMEEDNSKIDSKKDEKMINENGTNNYVPNILLKYTKNGNQKPLTALYMWMKEKLNIKGPSRITKDYLTLGKFRSNFYPFTYKEVEIINFYKLLHIDWFLFIVYIKLFN